MGSKKATEKYVQRIVNARQKKLKRIKNRINTGKYKISAWELAKAMIFSQ